MWAGLFWSRALLSVSTGLFLSYALFFSGQAGVKEVLGSIWLKAMVILFLIPLLSGIWSADIRTWMMIMFDKLPLLLFPFTIPAFREVNNLFKDKLLHLLIGFLLLSILYSIWIYFSIPDISSVYLKAKVLKVWMQDDHVRYSLLLLIALAWVIQNYLIDPAEKSRRWIGIFLIMISGLFIHILATKTGILGFYILMILLGIYKAKGLFRVGFIAAIFSLPVLSWFLIPSFQSRLRFVLWDFQNYSRGGYIEGLSDTPRVLSWQAGLDVFSKNIFMGVGAGDVKQSVIHWYSSHTPFLKDYEKLLPANEVLFYACLGGLLSGIVMLMGLVLPFFCKQRRNFLWIAFHVLFFMISMYEISLETQYGIFLYAFFGVLFFTISSPDHTSSRSSIAR